jgi:hypothetical protein
MMDRNHVKRFWLNMLVVGAIGWCSAVSANEDWQFWLDEAVSGHVAAKVKWSLKQQQRFRNDFNDLNFYHAEFKATYALNSSVGVSAGYRQQYVLRNRDWQEENWPIVTGTWKGTWRQLAWQNRNRLEIRFRGQRDTLVTYRNRTMLTGPIVVQRGSVRPYVFDELFVDSDEGELYRNRINAGVKSAPYGPIKCNTYLMWEITERNQAGWQDVFVIGGRIEWAF